MNSKQWLVYILRCKDGSFYTGITNDLSKRLQAHQEGKASRYTRSRLPVKLVYLESAANRSGATKREARIKKMRRKQKENLMRPSKDFSAVRNSRGLKNEPIYPETKQIAADA